jgi:hypothetical protein
MARAQRVVVYNLYKSAAVSIETGVLGVEVHLVCPLAFTDGCTHMNNFGLKPGV